MFPTFTSFECDAIRAEGLVGSEVQCCAMCHEQGYDIPFIVAGQRVRYTCCAVATAYDTDQERKYDRGREDQRVGNI